MVQPNLKTARSISTLAIFLSALFAVNSCDDTFDPLTGNIVDLFSVFGYLDAEADTQWVRIMPIRRSIDAIPDSIDAIVTLRELGEIPVQMKPRLFNFINIVGDSVMVWNFWTDLDVKPDTGYELVITKPNGEITRSTVYTPPETATPVMQGSRVTINNAPNLIDIRLNWKVYHPATDKTERFSFTHFAGAKNPMIQNTYQKSIDPNQNFVRIGQFFGYLRPEELYTASLRGEITVLETELVAISAGPDWQGLFDLTREELTVQSIENSNIENGVGYFVGSIGDIIPFEVCVGDEGESIWCDPSL